MENTTGEGFYGREREYSKKENDFAEKNVDLSSISIPERDKKEFLEYDEFVREYDKMVYDFYNSIIFASGNYSEFKSKRNRSKK